MFITAQGCRLRNDLYCVEWDVKLYYTIPYNCVVSATSLALRVIFVGGTTEQHVTIAGFRELAAID